MIANEERPSAPPLSVELTGTTDTGSFRFDWVHRIPPQWLGMTGYLVAGLFLGLVLIVTLSLTRSSDPELRASAGVVTDNVTRLHAADIGDGCWTGVAADAARLTISMEVGVDGKVHSAVASGGTAEMRSCVESHVKSWEFLPQAQAQAMVLPFEVDRR
jgi:hypothetical protein